jgi:hypothetical protein
VTLHYAPDAGAVRSDPEAADDGVASQHHRDRKPPADRVFTACMGTQLLVVQHLRRHLPRPEGRDFLIWHPLEEIGFVDRLMQSIIANAGFADTLDIRGFASLQPRTQGPAAWPLESTRRLRQDAATLRRWLARNRVAEGDIELWADDPIHFNVIFPRGLLRRSRHVKIPHAFNHEDATVAPWKEARERQWRERPWRQRCVFLPWQRWTSGVDLRMERVVYDRAYSFDLPSPWAADSIDVSELISLDAFAATYETLPPAMRAEVEAMLAPVRAGRRPLLVLLLFGLRPGPGPDLQPIYQQALRRIFAERAGELAGCTLAVKAHPGATGVEEKILIDWLRDNLPARVLPILHGLNLEFMLPQLQPDYVMAGLCGALPIVRRLGSGRPVALAEMIELYLRDCPDQRGAVDQFLRGVDIW